MPVSLVCRNALKCCAAALFALCQTVRVHSQIAEGKTIVWDPSTQRLVCAGGNYGRLIRLQDQRLLCAYDRGGCPHVSLSSDEGMTWGRPQRIACAAFAHGPATNVEALQMQNGWILLLVNERPKAGSQHPFAVQTHVSKDNAVTWERYARVYEADTRWQNGCWEPAAVQLPGGELQLFFANESPYRKSNEQEITLMRSVDNGATWQKPERVSFRGGSRDGMPVPLLLANGRGLVLAIEDRCPKAKLQPAIIWTSEEENWRGGTVTGDSRRRWPALPALPPSVYAGAPYICQFPTGETVLSCQSREQRQEDEMVVYVGNDKAQSFGGRSVPFKLSPGVAAKWNSVCVKNAVTVTAIATTRIDGVHGIRAIDGRLSPSVAK